MNIFSYKMTICVLGLSTAVLGHQRKAVSLLSVSLRGLPLAAKAITVADATTCGFATMLFSLTRVALSYRGLDVMRGSV